MNKIKVVHVPLGEAPRVVEIEDKLEPMQALVGGYIEYIDVGDGVAQICNEDGIALDLPQNGCGMLGPYFFMRVDHYTGDAISLTDPECSAIMAHVAMYRLVKHPGNSGVEVKSFNSMSEMQEYLAAHRRETPGEFN